MKNYQISTITVEGLVMFFMGVKKTTKEKNLSRIMELSYEKLRVAKESTEAGN